MTVSQAAEIIAEILHGVSLGERTEGIDWRRSETDLRQDLNRMRPSRR